MALNFLDSCSCVDVKLQIVLATLAILLPIVEAVLGRMYKQDRSPAGSVIGLVWVSVVFLCVIVWQRIKPKEKKDE